MTLDIAVLLVLVVVVGMLLRVMRGQRVAAAVARDTKSQAANAASDAAQAAVTSRIVLDRVEALGLQNRETAADVANDLAAAHDRADATPSGDPGAAADAAASSPVG